MDFPKQFYENYLQLGDASNKITNEDSKIRSNEEVDKITNGNSSKVYYLLDVSLDTWQIAVIYFVVNNSNMSISEMVDDVANVAKICQEYDNFSFGRDLVCKRFRLGWRDFSREQLLTDLAATRSEQVIDILDKIRILGIEQDKQNFIKGFRLTIIKAIKLGFTKYLIEIDQKYNLINTNCDIQITDDKNYNKIDSTKTKSPSIRNVLDNNNFCPKGHVKLIDYVNKNPKLKKNIDTSQTGRCCVTDTFTERINKVLKQSDENIGDADGEKLASIMDYVKKTATATLKTIDKKIKVIESRNKISKQNSQELKQLKTDRKELIRETRDIDSDGISYMRRSISKMTKATKSVLKGMHKDERDAMLDLVRSSIEGLKTYYKTYLQETVEATQNRYEKIKKLSQNATGKVASAVGSSIKMVAGALNKAMRISIRYSIGNLPAGVFISDVLIWFLENPLFLNTLMCFIAVIRPMICTKISKMLYGAIRDNKTGVMTINAASYGMDCAFSGVGYAAGKIRSTLGMGEGDFGISDLSLGQLPTNVTQEEFKTKKEYSDLTMEVIRDEIGLNGAHFMDGIFQMFTGVLNKIPVIGPAIAILSNSLAVITPMYLPYFMGAHKYLNGPYLIMKVFIGGKSCLDRERLNTGYDKDLPSEEQIKKFGSTTYNIGKKGVIAAKSLIEKIPIKTGDDSKVKNEL